MKIYTKTGDAGETALLGGGRVGKDHPRVAAYGAVDELNASLGVARAECDRAAGDRATLDAVSALLGEIQHRLFDLGAELANPNPDRDGATLVSDPAVERLEAAIDRHEATLPPLRQFVLPGGAPAAAGLHAARCACRSAERLLVSLARDEAVRPTPLRYLNRLSDLLFVLARAANQASGVADVCWSKTE